MRLTDFGPFWRILFPARLIFTDTVIIRPGHNLLPVVHTTPAACRANAAVNTDTLHGHPAWKSHGQIIPAIPFIHHSHQVSMD